MKQWIKKQIRLLAEYANKKEVADEFDVSERAEGDSKWSMRSLLRYSVENLMAFTSFPLRVVALVGFVTVAAGAIMALQTLWMYFTGRAVDGFTTVIWQSESFQAIPTKQPCPDGH